MLRYNPVTYSQLANVNIAKTVYICQVGVLGKTMEKGKVDPKAVTHERQGVEKQEASFYLTKAESHKNQGNQSSNQKQSSKLKSKNTYRGGTRNRREQGQKTEADKYSDQTGSEGNRD